MTPVKQVINHDPKNGAWGDCHRAAVASIMDLPLEAVPHFSEYGAFCNGPDTGDTRWFKARGLRPINIPYNGPSADAILETIENCNPGIIFIFGGTSRNGIGHSVVASRGKIIHDPSPTESGIVGPMEDGNYWATFIGMNTEEKHVASTEKT